VLPLDDFTVDEQGHVMTKRGLESIELAFQGIQLEMAIKKKKDNNGKPRLLLDGNIHGTAKPGRMLAVMGPSGAGKVQYSTVQYNTIQYNTAIDMIDRVIVIM
jgi:ABC-type glutathione transport system ATPase component